jgi:hypothetical protein
LPTWNSLLNNTSAGDQNSIGGSIGASIVAASPITLTASVHNITGTGTLSTLNGMVSGKLYMLISQDGFTVDNLGNLVTTATTVPAGRVLFLLFDGTKLRECNSLASQAVTIAGVETITGAKTFSAKAIFSSGLDGGFIRATTASTIPVAGAGAEMLNAGGTAIFQGFNRGSSTYLPVQLSGSSIDIMVAGVSKLAVDAGGITAIKNAGGAPTYLRVDNTGNTGGKIWRVGTTGAISQSTFDIYNQTDNNTPLSIDGAGNIAGGGTFRSTVQSIPASGIGVELAYDVASSTGRVRAYDRSGVAYKPLYLNDTIIVGAAGALELTAATGTIKERGRTTPLGEWIAFSPASRSASAGTWTVGTIVTAEYMLVGKTMIIRFHATGTSLSGTPQWVAFTIPGSFVAATTGTNSAQIYDNGTQRTGCVYNASADSSIYVYAGQWPGGGTTYATSTTNTHISFLAVFSIQ